MGIWNSKKFRVGILLTLLLFLGQFFTALAQTLDPVAAMSAIDWLVVAAPIMTAIGAQGLADFGKEKAKLEEGQK